MNNEEIDIEKIFSSESVKPLSEGLGFHHSLKKKSEVELSLKNKTKSLEADLKKRVQELNHKKNNTYKFGEQATMGDLSAFYNESKLESQINVTSSNLDSNKNYAGYLERTFAFLVDITIISFLSFVLMTVSLFLTGFNLDEVVYFYLSNLYLLDQLVTFSLLFLFYFSVLDKTKGATLGKAMSGIYIYTHGSFSFLKSFFRSLFVLVTLPLIIPIVLCLHDRVFDTKVLRK